MFSSHLTNYLECSYGLCIFLGLYCILKTSLEPTHDFLLSGQAGAIIFILRDVQEVSGQGERERGGSKVSTHTERDMREGERQRQRWGTQSRMSLGRLH